MEELLLQTEKALRWYLKLTPEERNVRATEISEAFQMIVDAIDQQLSDED